MRRAPTGAELCLAGGAPIEPALSRSAVTHHLNYMRWCNNSPRTIDQRRYALNRLARHSGVGDLLEVTYEQVCAFRDRLTAAGQPLSVPSQKAELAHLRGFFRWALLEGLVTEDPMVRVPVPKIPRWLPHPIPEHELHEAIETARERIRPFYFLAAYAGLRAAEIAALKGEDLWWHHDPALLVVRRGKGGNPGTVPIGPVLEDELRRLPTRGWLFPKMDGTVGPLRAWSVSHLANDHLHRIGSSHTLHSCRHRFGTMVYRLSGGDLRLTQEMMRHASPVSTAIYTEVDQGHAAGVVAALPAPSSAPLAAVS